MYGKTFAALWNGSIRGKPDLQLVFIYMFSNCDADGNIDCVPDVIADATGLGMERVVAAIEALEAPDKFSRTRELEGRRIVPLDEDRSWGWHIVNHAKYLREGSDVHRKEKAAERQRKYRLRNAGVTHSNACVTPLSISVSSSVSVPPDGESEGAKADKEWQEVKALPGLNFSREVWLRLKQNYPKADFAKAVDECSLAWLAGDMSKQHFFNKLKSCLSASENPQEGVKKGMSSKAQYEMSLNECLSALDRSDDIGHCLSILRDKWGKTPINGRDPVQDAYEIHKRGKQ